MRMRTHLPLPPSLSLLTANLSPCRLHHPVRPLPRLGAVHVPLRRDCGYHRCAQRSLFTKLSLAYLLNSVALPALVGSVPLGITQGWYESGGPLEQAIGLLLSATVFVEGFKVLQPYALVKRYLVAPFFARSQLQLNRYWAPPPMLAGELFAEVVKTLGLCLLCAPHTHTHTLRPLPPLCATHTHTHPAESASSVRHTLRNLPPLCTTRSHP